MCCRVGAAGFGAARGALGCDRSALDRWLAGPSIPLEETEARRLRGHGGGIPRDAGQCSFLLGRRREGRPSRAALFVASECLWLAAETGPGEGRAWGRPGLGPDKVAFVRGGCGLGDGAQCEARCFQNLLMAGGDRRMVAWEPVPASERPRVRGCE